MTIKSFLSHAIIRLSKGEPGQDRGRTTCAVEELLRFSVISHIISRRLGRTVRIGTVRVAVTRAVASERPKRSAGCRIIVRIENNIMYIIVLADG